MCVVEREALKSSDMREPFPFTTHSRPRLPVLPFTLPVFTAFVRRLLYLCPKRLGVRG